MTFVIAKPPPLRHAEDMKQLSVNAFTDFNDREVARRILLDDPVLRVVLVSLKAGQALPEHAAGGLVTVYSLEGRVLFYEGAECCEMVPGKLIRLVPGRAHRLEAKEDSRLLVTMSRPADAAAWNSLLPQGQVLDLRETPRARRHGTVFYAFDQLQVGESFYLVNDHDPQPLQYQMEELRPGELSWDYEQRGPDEFRIKVSRIAPAALDTPETVMAGGSH